MTSKQSRAAMNAADYRRSLTILHRAAVGVILTRTREPFRVSETLREFAYAEQGMDYRMWTLTSGWQRFNKQDPEAEPQCDQLTEPFAALRAINPPAGQAQQGAAAFGDGVYVMMYPHHFIPKHPGMQQVLKEYCRRFAETKKRLIILAPQGFTLPQELEDDIIILDFETPSYGELGVSYDKLMGDIPDNKRPKFNEEQKARIIAGGAGMTAHEFETALSRALVTHNTKLPNVPHEDIMDVILKVKTEVVKRSEVLELMEAENMANVGGLSALKEWITMRRECFSQEAQEAGVDTPKGIALIGPPGCIAAGTLISYRRAKRNSSRKLAIEVFHDKFNRIRTYAGAQWSHTDTETLLHSWQAETGRVLYNRVRGVYDKGDKACVRIFAGSAGEVVLTEDHPVLIGDGTFRPAGEIVFGDEVLVRGSMKPTKSGKPTSVRKPREVVEGLKYYRSGWDKITYDWDVDATYRYKRQHRSRLVIEAQMNGLPYEEYVSILKYHPERAVALVTLGEEFDVHHTDENTQNDRLDNLRVLLRSDHFSLHEHGGQQRFNVEFTATATVEYVEDAGMRRTYDVLMEEPCSNFVVNDGIIVRAASCPKVRLRRRSAGGAILVCNADAHSHS